MIFPIAETYSKATTHINKTDNSHFNILVIDKSPGESLVIQSVLENPDYRVDTTNSIEQALEYVLYNNYNLLLLSTDATDESDLEFVGKVKNMEGTNNLAIIFLMAIQDKDEFVKNGLNIGAIEFIQKPVNEELLQLKVKNQYLSFKHRNEIRQAKKEMDQLKSEYTEKSKGLIASINYAKHIQKRILPSIDELENSLEDLFVFYEPKDTIGGDFYFAGEINNRLILIAADCTGHGVPGAMLSMVGYQFVDHIIKEMRIFDPAEILTMLDQKMKTFFKQGTTTNPNCIDAAVVVFRPESNTIEYASAKRPVYIQTSNDIELLKGDRISIGEEQQHTHSFETVKKEIHEDTWVYMGSDGFVDQFGGERNKKYGSLRFEGLLKTLGELPRAKSKKIRLSDEFYNWKRDRFQVDDVTILGCLLKTEK